ncbi:MAG: hypothetical protein H0U70_07825 [Tatlockia sp.]|nr:hypothetical protein [Tatlockia sp.]
MLNLLDLKIPLGKSSYYARFAILIYASSVLLLVNSACYLVLKVLITVFLLVKLHRILSNPIPYHEYSMLRYSKKGWILERHDAAKLYFEKTEMVIDTGLFFLLRLIQVKKVKYLVVFSDQLNEENYRLLNIQQKIS